MELHKKYRPKKFAEVSGQDQAVTVLQKFIKENNLPHAILFTGESGCGKTTLAKILKKELDCSDLDYTEINTADFRGIDTVREIRSYMNLTPIQGKCRIWLLDECQSMSKDAQNSLLKILEDPPKHVYFFLCTTDPNKLLRTIHTRCTEVKINKIPVDCLQDRCEYVCKQENKQVSKEVIEKVVEISEGSARKALVLLEQVLNLEDENQQIELLQSANLKTKAIDLARSLMDNRTKWPDVAKILKNLEEDPEQIRYLVLAYANNTLLSGKTSGRAANILQAFRDNFYDSKHAGLTIACYEVINEK